MAEKCGLAATESAQKPAKARSKSYFLSTNYHALLIMKSFETDSNSKRERDFAMAKAAVKAKAKAKRKSAKKPAAKKRKARR